jgi:hypothetical protein
VVRAGAPVDLSAFRDRPVTGQLLREATDFIMDAVRRELGVVRRESPPTEFARRPRPSELRGSDRRGSGDRGEVA